MYKLMFGAKRKPRMSREDFGRDWTTIHAEKAKKVPGISRYVINLAPDLSGSGSEVPYDGFAEVWFESEEAMRLSSRSTEARVTLEDEQHLFDLSTRFSVIVQEHVMIVSDLLRMGWRLARQGVPEQVRDPPACRTVGSGWPAARSGQISQPRRLAAYRRRMYVFWS